MRSAPETVSDTRSVGPARALRSLYTSLQMDHLIRRERARADRSDSSLSLVLFRAGSGIGQTRSMVRLARAALHRIRLTDEVGWFEEGCLAALLPDTTAPGALTFAEKVCAAANTDGVIPSFRIYAYPEHWFEEGKATLDASVPHAPAEPTRKLRRDDLIPFVAQGIEDEMTKEIPVEPLHQLLVHPTPYWKRTIDIIGASVGLLLALPVFILSALLIKLTSKGPVMFKQLRSGLGGQPFNIYKFRTMRPDAEQMKAGLRQYSEQDGPAFKMKKDPRITGIGKFLRMTSLDELPQLINVLKGEMSLVGPRPLPIDEANGCDQWQKHRLDVAPGLTCIWQIEGRSRVTFDEWMRMDARYIRRRNFWRDAWLMLKTLPAVLLRRGAQ